VLQRELATGRKIALLGPDGRPRWHRFLTEKRRLPLGARPGDSFRLEAWGVTLMELLPSPGMSAYRFEAEVLHEQSNQGMAGLFFAARESDAVSGEFSFCTLAYASHGADAGQWRLLRHRYAEAGTRPNGLDLYSPPLLSGRPPDLKPRVNSWRKLMVEVSRREVCVFWGDDPVRRISCDALERRTTRVLRVDKRPDRDPPPLDVSGGLGLYVDGSIARFKNVSLTLLSDK
jgi:hypothetical protein